jgi:endo-1,4-beta-xylanase
MNTITRPITRPAVLTRGLGLRLTAALLLANVALAQPALKTVFKDQFLVGAALNDAVVSAGAKAKLVAHQFNSITPENVMKWESIQPRPGEFNFAPADRFVEFGRRHEMFIVGHALVWHQQTPAWVFEARPGQPADRTTLLTRMSNHIHTVVSRYRGRVHGWDVVNEALAEDGSLRTSPWLKIIGEDYLVKAFEFAQAADPGAELYYNDYSLENPPKRAGAVRLIRKLQAAGIKVRGLGTQMHAKMDWPTPELVADTLVAFSQLGVPVMITELDLDVLPARSGDRGAEVSRRESAAPELNPYTNGLPAAVQTALANRYRDLFAMYVKHADKISRVTFWGVTDGDSWLNHWPIRGRTAHPLLFDRAGKPKPAFDAVLQTAPPPLP